MGTIDEREKMATKSVRHQLANRPGPHKGVPRMKRVPSCDFFSFHLKDSFTRFVTQNSIAAFLG